VDIVGVALVEAALVSTLSPNSRLITSQYDHKLNCDCMMNSQRAWYDARAAEAHRLPNAPTDAAVAIDCRYCRASFDRERTRRRIFFFFFFFFDCEYGLSTELCKCRGWVDRSRRQIRVFMPSLDRMQFRFCFPHTCILARLLAIDSASALISCFV
jgi:hypothetical protein